MKMNLSKYVRVIQGNDSTILFNTINASIIEFTYQKSNDINILLQEMTDDEVNYLRENLFFISEQNAMKLFFTEPVSPVLNITISLTEFCNLKCRYCYEGNLIRRSVISPETIDNIVQYIYAILSRDKRKSIVNIDLIGGEPLLEIEQIQYLIQKLNPINDVTIYFTLETNGTLFSKQVQEVFKEMNVLVSVPLTIETDQNTMRPFKNGDASYITIVENLAKAKAFFESEKHQLVLRYNAHKENIKSFGEFFKTVSKTIPYHFEIELARIINYPYNSPCSTLSHTEYSEWFLKTYFEYTEDAYSRNRFLLPGKRYSSCTAYMPDDIKIHADGSLALCNAWIPQNRCGNIEWLLCGKTKKDIFSAGELYRPDVDNECYACPDLFLCGGKKICNRDNPCEFVDFDINRYIAQYVYGRKGNQ